MLLFPAEILAAILLIVIACSIGIVIGIGMYRAKTAAQADELKKEPGINKPPST